MVYCIGAYIVCYTVLQISQITGKCSFTTTANYFVILYSRAWIGTIHHTALSNYSIAIISNLSANGSGCNRYIYSRSSCNCRHDNLYCCERFLLAICNTLFVYSIRAYIVCYTILQISQITSKCSFTSTANYFVILYSRAWIGTIHHTALSNYSIAIISNLSANGSGCNRYIYSRSSCNCRHDNLYCCERFLLAICNTLFVYSIRAYIVCYTVLQISQIAGKCSFTSTANDFVILYSRAWIGAIHHTALSNHSIAFVSNFSTDGSRRNSNVCHRIR